MCVWGVNEVPLTYDLSSVACSADVTYKTTGDMFPFTVYRPPPHTHRDTHITHTQRHTHTETHTHRQIHTHTETHTHLLVCSYNSLAWYVTDLTGDTGSQGRNLTQWLCLWLCLWLCVSDVSTLCAGMCLVLCLSKTTWPAAVLINILRCTLTNTHTHCNKHTPTHILPQTHCDKRTPTQYTL